MSYPFHTSMNDANHTTSPAQTNETVGNSPKSAQIAERVQSPEKDSDFSLRSVWAAFQNTTSANVANSSKPLTHPQVSLYSSYYGTLIQNIESGEGVASSGQIVQTLDYYPYGSKRINSGTDVSSREYIGQYQDNPLDISYLNARYYDGRRGQFLSQDPMFWEVGQTKDGRAVLANPQAQNSYSYAENNPIVKKDPDGKFAMAIPLYYGAVTAPQWVPWVIGGAIGLVGGNYLFQNMPNPSTYKAETLADGGARFSTPRFDPDPPPGENPKAPQWMKTLLKVGVTGSAAYQIGDMAYKYYESTKTPANTDFWAYYTYSSQLNSRSVETRYQATQSYNTATGATSNQAKLWTTPNGAVVSWDGQVVAPAPKVKK